MRFFCLGIFALLIAACSTPYTRFDEGYQVHFIVVSPPAEKGDALDVQPVCTVGDHVHKTPRRRLAGAAEVAVVHVPAGDYRAAVWDARTASGGHVNLAVDHDLWVVMELRPGDVDRSMKVHDMPPRDRDWTPLVMEPR